MLSVLLDTHILVWWRAEPERLSQAQSRILRDLESRSQPVGISAITLWELAKLVQLGRRRINQPLGEWLAEIETHPMIRVLPIDAAVVTESVQLGDDFHRDPADQIIVATARCHHLRLLTADERILRWGKVSAV
jgi:PIN domain nuclease of toxin-antitoxin system